MRESYAEGPATHSGPESCGHAREDMFEALTGERVGRVLSRERTKVPGAQAVHKVEGNTNRPAMARGGGSGAVEDPLHARKHLAREPGDPASAPGKMEPWGCGGKSKDASRR
jgi:hypothetical protein